jgi:hypothetical protein
MFEFWTHFIVIGTRVVSRNCVRNTVENLSSCVAQRHPARSCAELIECSIKYEQQVEKIRALQSWQTEINELSQFRLASLSSADATVAFLLMLANTCQFLCWSIGSAGFLCSGLSEFYCIFVEVFIAVYSCIMYSQACMNKALCK